jgi:hypothetical protein
MDRTDMTLYHANRRRWAKNGVGHVIHFAHHRLGAWCNDDVGEGGYTPKGRRYAMTRPVTCFWCLAGLRWGW